MEDAQARKRFAKLEETHQVAEAAFPSENIFLTLRDALGTIFED